MDITKVGFTRLLISLCLALLWAACGAAPAGGGRDSLELALADALQLGDPLLRAERLASRLQRLDTASAEAALDVFERHLELATVEDAAWFATGASRADPVRTLDRVLQWPRPLRERGAAEAVAEWARRDPAAASAELRGRPALDLGAALVRGWAEADPEAAIRFVDAQPPGSSRANQVRALVEVLRRQHTDSGMDWLERMMARTDLSAPTRRELVVAAVGSAARFDPLGTATWLSPRLGAAETPGAIAALAAEWGSLDPPGTAAWLTSLAASAERDRALRDLQHSWRAREPQQAERWRSESSRKPRAPSRAGAQP